MATDIDRKSGTGMATDVAMIIEIVMTTVSGYT
jgi:hypothetical protein